jgi:hypothetical protein
MCPTVLAKQNSLGGQKPPAKAGGSSLVNYNIIIRGIFRNKDLDEDLLI